MLRPHFIQETWNAALKIQKECIGLHALIGLPRVNPKSKLKPLVNSCAIMGDGGIQFYDKMLLPTYDEFYEGRYFERGQQPCIFKIKNKNIALTICEDLWEHSQFLEYGYSFDPIDGLINKQIDLLINISASPFYVGKESIRKKVAQKVAKTLDCSVLLVNQVGGNDTLIFDGNSFFTDSLGRVIDEFPPFQEVSRLIGSNRSNQLSENEQLLEALTLGLKDFCQKLGFQKVLIGLSGGIDSTLVAALAQRALGKENVTGVMLPSRYSSKQSVEDAKEFAEDLGIKVLLIPIESSHSAILETLNPIFNNMSEDLTEENIQSRLRGLILMALSNKFKSLLLNTGNKSEYAVGYATLYGDMCGALSVIGDLTKKQVYNLSKHMNLPKKIIDKEPSAELKMNQKDSDTLPPYPILDLIVTSYIEDNLSAEKIASLHDIETSVVREWTQRIDLAEYKRHQAPPILKVTKKSLSFGRHFPIVKTLSN